MTNPIKRIDKTAKMNLGEIKAIEKQTMPKEVDEMSVFEQMMLEHRKEALKEGREEGRKEALEEGREEGARYSLLFLLKRKFTRIPKRIVSRIEQIRDLAVLQSLTVSAAMSESLQEFEEDLM